MTFAVVRAFLEYAAIRETRETDLEILGNAIACKAERDKPLAVVFNPQIVEP